MENPLRPVVSEWISKIRLGLEHKKRVFGDDADEAMRFFSGPYGFLYSQKYLQGRETTWAADEENPTPAPSFQMTCNKAAEMVQLYGPALYHRNPVRQVNPRRPPPLPPELMQILGAAMGSMGMMGGMMPGGEMGMGMMGPSPAQMQLMMAQQQAAAEQAVDAGRAALLEHYLNYTPNALDLKTESRWAVDEALIKGLGVLWTEVYNPPAAGLKFVGSFYDTVDNLVLDPDAERMRECTWVARRCCHPVWEVEREYGLPPGSLRGNAESFSQQTAVDATVGGDYWRKQGLTNDLLVYWKVFSKMGMGGRLKGVKSDLGELLEPFGDFCYLAIAEHIPYPFNLPPEVIGTGTDQDLLQRAYWPTPFWADDAWPFAGLCFHDTPRCPWPVSHLKPGMGELKFLNWVYSFVAGKIKTACRDFIAVTKGASEDIKNAITHGRDYTLIEIEKQHGTISDVVQFLQHPEFNGDIWRVLEAVMESFEKRVGLNELMYGMTSNQLRSAQEAALKGDQIKIRPDDMANKTEDWMTQVSRLEALAARWHLTGQDIYPVMGPLGAQLWDQLVYSTDPRAILHQLEYRIEAGSARKPNKDRDASNMQQGMQTLFTALFQYAMQTGNVGPVNALLTAWAKSIDLEASAFLLAPPPMPMAPPAPGPGAPAGPNQQAA